MFITSDLHILFCIFLPPISQIRVCKLHSVTLIFNTMEKEILKELQELKNLTLLGAKKALTMPECALLTGLSKSHLYKLVCAKKIPYYKGQGSKITYFNKDEVTEWMLQRRVATSLELETEAANYVVIGRKGSRYGK